MPVTRCAACALAPNTGTQVAAGASGLFACPGPLSASPCKLVFHSLRYPYSPPNAGCRRRFEVARLHRLAARSSRAVRPLAASARFVPQRSRRTKHRRSAPSLFGPARSRSTKGKASSSAGHAPAPHILVRFPTETQSKLAARRSVAQPFHRADSQKHAAHAFVCRSCQTLGPSGVRNDVAEGYMVP